MQLEQTPPPDSCLIRRTGETLTVTLTLPEPRTGQALLRTNLGNLHLRQEELIRAVEHATASQEADWQDLPMTSGPGAAQFSLTLPLSQVGYFQAKAFFVDNASQIPSWPAGGNLRLKVEPADTWHANTIYNAFVRLFGPDKNRPRASRQHLAAEQKLDAAGYAVIPPSGTFADLQQELDFIIGTLGFRIIQLLPIHPVPTTYARMGRFGSPFAPLDFFAVDPALARFNPRKSPLEQFDTLVEHIHARQARVFLDLPADHSGWSSTLQLQHPEWFLRYPDGTFQSPGAWGITWEDLCKFDFTQTGLWTELARVFLHWCQHGVDGFRCDAGYMIPAPVWQYIITKVRRQYPDTLFFLEGLGGKIEDTRTLLCEANHNWAYSELFQQFDQPAIHGYLRFANDFSNHHGILVHFAETHDNNRLAAVSPQWARQRTALAALTAPAGAFGITCGVEWLATEKIDVHQCTALNWGSHHNLVEWISTLNRLLHDHPAFAADATITAIDCPQVHHAGAFLRTACHPAPPLLLLFNYSQEHETEINWDSAIFAPPTAYDCLTGRKITLNRHHQRCHLRLQPGDSLCLAAEPTPTTPHSAGQSQTVQAWLTDLFVRRYGLTDCRSLDFVRLARDFLADPAATLAALPGAPAALPLLAWNPERDARRLMPLPSGHLLTLQQPAPMRAEIVRDGECLLRRNSVRLDDGTHFLFLPFSPDNQPATLQLTLFSSPETQHLSGQIIPLADSLPDTIPLRLDQRQITPLHCGLCTNTASAYALARAAWGTLASQYDALLAANLNPAVPIEKTILLTRCRAWVICHNFSRELKLDCQTAFALLDSGELQWDFNLPTVKGTRLHVHIRLTFDPQQNRLQLAFFRSGADQPDDPCPATLVIRPDLDDRSHHTHTKAFSGPEHAFPAAVQPTPNGFSFSARNARLDLQISHGSFHPSPEWTYQVRHPQDAERGLEADGDLFSPGYFNAPLTPTTPVILEATAQSHDQPRPKPPTSSHPLPDRSPQNLPLEATLRRALDKFIVRRDAFQTVMAGYPWFLDWGRDTLIALRGMISAGKHADARSIIGQFAAFEEHGTLPNMIRGHDVSNRDTSDAPLWLFTAVNDLLQHEKSDGLLELPCGNRNLIQVLSSIAEHYWNGTPNGIRACHQTALVFSPPHFTWMDTNYPACSPRQGYPVEIQALWIAALQLLHRATGHSRYAEWAEMAQGNLNALFLAKPAIGLADCLLAQPGTPASAATPDDACRPNQLLAITLGAVTDPQRQRHILQAVQPLLIPGAIRSLADQPVTVPITVHDRGRDLNDPLHPYCGHYAGDEDTRRKPAYHNGTAWGWMMPSFSEALLLSGGKAARPAAHAWLAAVRPLLLQACLGQLPEINDGNAPHTPRGCQAQAWSISEFLRVLLLCQNRPDR